VAEYRIGMQHKDLDKVENDVEDLVGLGRTLNLKWGSGGLLLIGTLMMYRAFMLRNLSNDKENNKNR